MPAWGRFLAAYVSGLPNYETVESLRRVEQLLDLPVQQAQDEFEKQYSAAEPRALYQKLNLLSVTIQREIGIPLGPNAPAEVQKLIQECQPAPTPDEKHTAAQRLWVLWALAGTLIQKHPGINKGPGPEQIDATRLQQAGVAIFARLEPVQGHTSQGTVTPESIAQLESNLADANHLISTAAPNNTALSWLHYMTGSTSRILAGCYVIAGRNQDALGAFAEAADHFTKSGDPKEAEDCNNRARDLQQRLSGAFDDAAKTPLDQLRSNVADADPFERIRALMNLADIAGSVGDTFEDASKANAAAMELTQVGYLDPGECGAEAAMDSWITTASAKERGVPLLGILSQVGVWYDAILGARLAAVIRTDKDAATSIEQSQRSVRALHLQLLAESGNAQQKHTRDLARFFGAAAAGTQPGEPSSNSSNLQAFIQKCIEIDDALYRIQITCNERTAAGQPLDDLLTELKQWETKADALNTPEYEAKVRLQQAYVLGHAGRALELIPIVQEARKRLLHSRAPSIWSLPKSHERYLYLESLKREMQGEMIGGNAEAGLQIGEAVIRDYEIGRYRVANEFRQTAALSEVADFYVWSALAALKLNKWDNMLAAIDLIKARSAVRNRLVEQTNAVAESQLESEFEELSNQIAANGSDPALRERRRQLWDLLSISRRSGAKPADIPELTLNGLQAALREDEALIAYFWLNDVVLLAIGVDRNRFHAQRIVLKPEQADKLNRFFAFIQALAGAQERMGAEVARLGDILLPSFLREFMQAKKRVLFSPHRWLHLFPFHAARWDSGFVGTEFAVSYVPNFGSLLLPWNKQLENRVLTIGLDDPNLDMDEESRVIKELYAARGAKVDVIFGPNATRERLRALRDSGDLAKFRCVHFGTHGNSVLRNPNQPLESSITMQDGELDVMDIANLRFDAELVVLSACHSGQRAIELRNLGAVPGDEIFGLQAAFFRSGVRSILGTLWIVETKSAAAITREFHRHFAAGEPAETALHQSIKAYLDDPNSRKSVYYWAPYFISSVGRAPMEATTQCRN